MEICGRIAVRLIDLVSLMGIHTMLHLESDKETTFCPGRVFKATAQNYTTKNGGFGFTVRLVPVKKMSCPGCEKCMWQRDNFGEVTNDWPLLGIEGCENGKFYTVKGCNESRDNETGQIDSWDLCLIEYHNKG